jgi:signal peptidase I
MTDVQQPSVNSDSAPAEGKHYPVSRLLITVALAILALFTLRQFVVRPVAVPTRSMEPTLLHGDVALVSLLPYRIHSPEYLPFTRIEIPSFHLNGLSSVDRRDVVLFTSPEQRRYEPTPDLVKRCMGLPGDTLTFREGIMYVNGDSVARYVGRGARRVVERKRMWPLFRDRDSLIIPYRGYQLDLDSVSARDWKSAIRREGYVVEYRNRIVFLNGRPATKYRFRNDYIIVLGDNRDDSRDSRQFGFVPTDNLIGRLSCVLWSDDPDDGMRWDRIGHGID